MRFYVNTRLARQNVYDYCSIYYLGSSNYLSIDLSSYDVPSFSHLSLC